MNMPLIPAFPEPTIQYRTILTERSPMKRKALVEAAYLDFFNHYLTVESFARDSGCTAEQAADLIAEGKHWNNLPKVTEVRA